MPIQIRIFCESINIYLTQFNTGLILFSIQQNKKRNNSAILFLRIVYNCFKFTVGYQRVRKAFVDKAFYPVQKNERKLNGKKQQRIYIQL